MATREPFTYRFNKYYVPAEQKALMESLAEDTKSFGDYYDDYANALARNKESIDIKEKIANNEARIAELNARNDEIKAKEYEDPNDRLARIEMLKIGEPGQVHDATSFWRWNENRKDAKEQQQALLERERLAKEMMNQQAKNKFINDSRIYLDYNPDDDELNDTIKNIKRFIADGDTNHYDITELQEKNKELIERKQKIDAQNKIDVEAKTKFDALKAGYKQQTINHSKYIKALTELYKDVKNLNLSLTIGNEIEAAKKAKAAADKASNKKVPEV